VKNEDGNAPSSSLSLTACLARAGFRSPPTSQISREGISCCALAHHRFPFPKAYYFSVSEAKVDPVFAYKGNAVQKQKTTKLSARPHGRTCPMASHSASRWDGPGPSPACNSAKPTRVYGSCSPRRWLVCRAKAACQAATLEGKRSGIYLLSSWRGGFSSTPPKKLGSTFAFAAGRARGWRVRSDSLLQTARFPAGPAGGPAGHRSSPGFCTGFNCEANGSGAKARPDEQASRKAIHFRAPRKEVWIASVAASLLAMTGGRTS